MSERKAIIIEDELPARELIKVFLKDYKDITLIAEAENGFEGAKLINLHKPDLVFLDIQMPKIDGFEMLELLDEQPAIIFCTAYDEFAIKAFDKNAIDYLLKPFSKLRFDEAIAKVNVAKANTLVSVLPTRVDSETELKRIVIKDRKEIVIVDVKNIEYLEAQDDYVEIHTAKGSWLKQQTMNYFEYSLNDNLFVRVHRKYIIAIEEIAKLDKLGKETHVALLKNGKSIPVSLSGYKKLKHQLGL